jgi:predicted transcriptional regulator
MQRFRKYTDGITFFVSRDMRKKLDDMAESRELSVSQILREILNAYFADEQQTTIN